jgi:hypothetical protein
MAAPLAEWFTPFRGLRAIPDPWVVENLRGYEIVGESEWGITGSFMKLPMR